MGASVTAVPTHREIEDRRLAVSMEAMARPGKDLADLTEVEFEEGLKRLKVVQHRIHRLLEEALVDGAHYGIPETSNGRQVFKKPMLYQAGAEELRRLLRYSVRKTTEDLITVVPPSPEEPEGFVSVVVERGVVDAAGRLCSLKRGACTSKEGRFRSNDGKGWTYKDAREKLHDILVMAEKRAAGLATREASGATAFLANEEEMDEAMESDRPITPWTAEERRVVKEAAMAKGVGRRAFAELVQRTLGRDEVGTGPDVMNLLDAIKKLPTPTAGQAGGDE